MSRPKKRNGPRYTPPQPKAAKSGPDAPLPLPDAPVTDEDREAGEFWHDMERQGQDLRTRCNALLHPNPPTSGEWQDADLQSMEGDDATDEELIAYWRVHRAAIELGLEELPHLAQVAAYLDAGQDPVEAMRKEYDELMADDD